MADDLACTELTAVTKEPRTAARGLRAVLRRRLTERVHYRRARDWWLSLYNRALLRASVLPFRGRVCTIAPTATTRPVHLRLGTSDWYVFEEIFARQDYRPVLESVDAATTILDLGANIGMSVRFWEDRFPGARVIAVEPDEASAALCRRNAETAQIVRACVAAHSRPVYLDRSGGAWTYQMTERPQGERIPTVTVPELLAQAGIEGEVDLLKCDIEGAEAEVFGACREWIGRVRELIVEVHHPYTSERLLADVGPEFEAHHRAPGGACEVVFLRRRRGGLRT